MSKTAAAIPRTIPRPVGTPVVESGPYGGVPATVLGVIQAEEFDEGGEGVAYSDSSDGNNQGVGRTS